mgnify:CR=1 FL=1
MVQDIVIGVVLLAFICLNFQVFKQEIEAGMIMAIFTTVALIAGIGAIVMVF